jgi:electron transfer flavoprotein alpha subunit
MKIAIVSASDDVVALTDWIIENGPDSAQLERWIMDPVPDVAEQILGVLEAQWLLTPVDILIFAASPLGDELATRLAWRLSGGSVCQAKTLDVQQGLVSKSHWGNALNATLNIAATPLCLSLARQSEARVTSHALPTMTERRLEPVARPDWLEKVETVAKVSTHPLLQANCVLVVGQGNGYVDEETISALAQSMTAEVGYSRARVMNGGFDAERVIGISGHLLSPDVCIVAGASGAAALMAGVHHSQFIVAINSDPSAPVFFQADVGVVDDWLPVLEALAAFAEN